MIDRSPSALRWLRDTPLPARDREADDGQRLPLVGSSGLTAAGVHTDDLVEELRRMAATLVPGWAAMRPPDSIASGIASSVAEHALEAMAELDATAVIVRAAELDVLDRALAEPLSLWSRRESAEPTEPPLRVVARDVLASERGPSVIGVVLGAVGSVRLAATIQQRRQALRQLGAELDRIADSDGPVTEIALLVAARAREAVALGEALVHHLDRAGTSEATAFSARWRELTVAVSSRLARTLAAVDRLVGMEH